MNGRHTAAALAMTATMPAAASSDIPMLCRQQTLCIAALTDAAENQAEYLEQIANTLDLIYKLECMKS